MKIQSLAVAVAIFTLGAIVGHTTTLSYNVADTAIVAQISTDELTLKATNLPVETADAI